MNDKVIPARWPLSTIDHFAAIARQFDDLVRDYKLSPTFAGTGPMAGFQPRIDAVEHETELLVTAELPGLDEADIEVTLQGRRLTIKGEKRTELPQNTSDDGKVVHAWERSWGRFERMMMLPFDLDPKKVAAEFKNGVLTIRLPKPATPREEARRIEIKSVA